jgi:hypothetical protein
MSWMEKTLANHEHFNTKNINAAKKGNVSTLPKFSARDSALSPGEFDLPGEDWSYIDIHTPKATGMDAFLNAVIKSAK